MLGRGLHSIQDKIAHGNRTFLLPHPSWVDDAKVRLKELGRTEIQTRNYIKIFLKRINRL